MRFNKLTLLIDQNLITFLSKANLFSNMVEISLKCNTKVVCNYLYIQMKKES